METQIWNRWSSYLSVFSIRSMNMLCISWWLVHPTRLQDHGCTSAFGREILPDASHLLYQCITFTMLLRVVIIFPASWLVAAHRINWMRWSLRSARRNTSKLMASAHRCLQLAWWRKRQSSSSWMMRWCHSCSGCNFNGYIMLYQLYHVAFFGENDLISQWFGAVFTQSFHFDKTW